MQNIIKIYLKRCKSEINDIPRGEDFFFKHNYFWNNKGVHGISN